MADKLIVIYYKCLNLEYCIYIRDRFIVDVPVYDTNQCDVAASLVCKYEIKKVILSTACSLRVYRIFKSINVDVHLIEDKHFNIKKICKQETRNCVSINCLNAMIEHLEINVYKQHIGVYMYKPGPDDKIGDVGIFPVYKSRMNNFLYIDSQTMKDLHVETQIFNKINFTKTAYGKKELRNILLFPLKNKSDILKRYAMIEEIKKAKITNELKKIPKVEDDGILNVFNFPGFLLGFMNMAKKFDNTALSFPLGAYNRLHKQIDIFEGNDLKNGMFMQYDKLIELYVNLPVYLSKIAKKIVKNSTMGLSIIYMPQIGYLIEIGKDVDYRKLKIIDFVNTDVQVKKHHLYESINPTDSFCESINISETKRSTTHDVSKPNHHIISTDNDLHIPNETLLQTFSHLNDRDNPDLTESSTRARYNIVLCDKVYFKTNVMRMLDDELGDLTSLINEYKNNKISEVRELAREYQIEKIFDYVGLIDAINSLYLYSIRYNCIRPVISEIKIISINNFYDYKVNIDFCKNILYTGTGDILRIVGEAVLLFHIGSYLPCKRSRFYIHDKLFTLIDVEESLTTATSYFLASIKCLARILKCATPDTLCLIGDLGYGTNYQDGMALLFAVLKSLKDSFVISSSLYRELLEHTNECGNPEIDQNASLQKSNNTSHDCVPAQFIEDVNICAKGKKSIYTDNISNETMTCICLWYSFGRLSTIGNSIMIDAIQKHVSSKNILLHMDISESMKRNLSEYIDRLEKNNSIIMDKNNDWARQVITEFIRKYKIEHINKSSH